MVVDYLSSSPTGLDIRCPPNRGQVPPPWWTGIDTTQDPTDQDTKEIARAGWHNAQNQPEPTNLAPAEIIQKAHNRQKALN